MASATSRRPANTKDRSSSPTRVANGISSTHVKMATRRFPLQPTMLEVGLLALYPATLLLGSLFSILNPATRASSYNTLDHSHIYGQEPSYFAQKTNLFNVIFVKRGWFWVSLSYFLFLFTHPSTGPFPSLTLTPRRIRGITRWGMVTVWWIFVTQWFFGPPIIDRSFTLTGGQCELLEKGNVEMDEARKFVTGLACKAVGGKWKGGHDISGHVFLLVLGSMFLLEEALHVMLRAANQPEERTILMRDGTVRSAEEEAPAEVIGSSEAAGNMGLGVKFLLGVAGLSFWMLLMTAVYFHTWFEKVCSSPHFQKALLQS
jgi:Inositol phospholipid synthesis and fat-storage-inducing TM